MDDITQYVVQGCCVFGVILIGAIWNELRGMRVDIKSLSITQTRQENRLDNLEKIVDKIPCNRQMICPK